VEGANPYLNDISSRVDERGQSSTSHKSLCFNLEVLISNFNCGNIESNSVRSREKKKMRVGKDYLFIG